MALTGVNAAFLLHFRKNITYSIDILWRRKHDCQPKSPVLPWHTAMNVSHPCKGVFHRSLLKTLSQGRILTSWCKDFSEGKGYHLTGLLLCLSIPHWCCHSGKWGMAVMAGKFCISSRHCQWAAADTDSSTQQHYQNRSEKLFHYRNRRCDLKIVLLGSMNWILAIDQSTSCVV